MEKTNLYKCDPRCTEVALRNAATFLDPDDPHFVRILLGRTKNTDKTGLAHCEAEAYDKKEGKWRKIINKGGFAVLDDEGDGLITKPERYLTVTEAAKMWVKPGKED